jgi:hypothetical protein
VGNAKSVTPGKFCVNELFHIIQIMVGKFGRVARGEATRACGAASGQGVPVAPVKGRASVAPPERRAASVGPTEPGTPRSGVGDASAERAA